MIVIQTPEFPWIGSRFVCGSCSAVIVFQLSDLRNKTTKPRKTMSGGWVVRAHCAVCGNPLANFTQEAEDDHAD